MNDKYFSNLTYSIGDEDNNIEFQILPINRNHIVSVCGSGTRIVPLLSKNPRKITCVDISQEQLDLTALRIEAVRQLDYQTFISFLGYSPTNITTSERKSIFELLALETDLKKRLVHLFETNKWKPVIYYGKFEKTLIKLSKINRIITGKTGIEIFDQPNIEKQQQYYKNQFSQSRFNITIALLGNSSVLNSILYKGRFPKKNIQGSHYRNFKNVFHNLFTKINIQESFFLQLVFLGKIAFPQGNLLEADKNVFEKAKVSLNNCTIKYSIGDITNIIKRNPENDIDFVSYSDVPSFLSVNEATSFLQEIKHKITKDTIVISKGFLRVVSPNYVDYFSIAEEYKSLIETDNTQLWKYQIYKRT
jgi:S-adenosylmethionine-diacylglycerol 3-amino-3-carboxypropyl transferase